MRGHEGRLHSGRDALRCEPPMQSASLDGQPKFFGRLFLRRIARDEAVETLLRVEPKRRAQVTQIE